MASALSWVAGIGVLQCCAALPSVQVLTLLAAAAGLVAAAALAADLSTASTGARARSPRRAIAMAWLSAVACAGFAYAGLRAADRMADALPPHWERRDIELIGVISELTQRSERGLRFAFDVQAVLTEGAVVPRRILLGWYTSRRSLASGTGSAAANADEDTATQLRPAQAAERWQLVVRLRGPRGPVNPNGFDVEAWLLERDLRATGYVRRSISRLDQRVERPLYLVERAREHIRARFEHVLGDARYLGVLAALAIGDQRAIPAVQWEAFTRTGINHLMSISGLHVTMVAALVFWLVDRVWRRSGRLAARCPARKPATLAGLAAAFAYAMLAGFSVPTQRTVFMLSVIAFALWQARRPAPFRVLAAALLLVSVIDPWCVLAPGFWLSFGAVALMMSLSVGRLGTTGAPASAPSMARAAATMAAGWARVQWAITVGMVPITLALFAQVSLLSPIANAFAIPLVSLVVVPAALTCVLIPWPPLLHFTHAIAALALRPIEYLSALPWAVWLQPAPPEWAVAAALAGVLWWAMPAGWPARWLGLASMLPLLLIRPAPIDRGSIELTMLDVGHGLSVAVRTRAHVMVYDTGPAWNSEADAGGRIVLPFLRARGVRHIDRLVVSHDDVDHSGGAASLMRALPVGALLSSLPPGHRLVAAAPVAARCEAGQSWTWDDVHFRVLHPSAASYSRRLPDNERGCVISIEASGQRVLLTADIGVASEQALIAGDADAARLRADVMLVPHHGSRGSSSAAFVAAVAPATALVSAGYLNRFGHPRPEIVERYRQAGASVRRTDLSGALQVHAGPAGVRVVAERTRVRRYWRERTAEDE